MQNNLHEFEMTTMEKNYDATLKRARFRCANYLIGVQFAYCISRCNAVKLVFLRSFSVFFIFHGMFLSRKNVEQLFICMKSEQVIRLLHYCKNTRRQKIKKPVSQPKNSSSNSILHNLKLTLIHSDAIASRRAMKTATITLEDFS